VDGKKPNKDVSPGQWNYVADQLRVRREDLSGVLSEWSHEQLLAHLAQFPADEFKRPGRKQP
jgi:hypothetical protein